MGQPPSTPNRTFPQSPPIIPPICALHPLPPSFSALPPFLRFLLPPTHASKPRRPFPAPIPESASDVDTDADADAADADAEDEDEDEFDTQSAIDMETFHQILDLDEDDTHDFSFGMAEAYFSQANTTFVDMDEALKNEDLTKLSSLGHFLKGSSAALGVAKVQASCEQIQHYGALRDEDTGTDLDAPRARKDRAASHPCQEGVRRRGALAQRLVRRARLCSAR
ncbi:Multistep phosphorelay regulator 1 [Grifola frondosa]|uniref:Multistep phosphorelay regulator 1 n=1 Tax=Grifola frondosa TaxID=5627 RepID=A0A1C7M4W8_GRIFR|nr:Multistep phosphorelay regulator 1 [Grifola frondosa]